MQVTDRMERWLVTHQSSLAVCLILVGSIVGCGTGLYQLAPGQAPTSNPVAISAPRSIARGGLAYHSALLGSRLLLTVELRVRFELVVRRIDRDGKRVSFHELHRVDLGPPDWDITGLAVAKLGPLAWVSSRDGSVRSINVESGAVVANWRSGASATAVAVSADGAAVVYGTSSGLVCLRRTRDGALLQCMIASDDAEISAISLNDNNANIAVGTSKGALTRWTLPGLARAGSWQLGAPIRSLAFKDDSLLISTGERLGAKPRWRGGGVFVQTDGVPRECFVGETPTSAISWINSASNALVSGSADGVLRLHRIVADKSGRVTGIDDVTKPDEKTTCTTVRVFRASAPIATVVSHPDGGVLGIGLWSTEPDTPSVLVANYLYRTR